MTQRVSVKEIELDIEAVSDLALIASDDSVWLVVMMRWWDIATWLWWFLHPADKRARLKLTMKDERIVSVKAVRVATRHARLRGRVSSS
jgi:hypothetical protein